MTIGQHINLARNKRNMTIKELSEKSGVSEWTLCAWIYQGHLPTIMFLICVADVLECSLDELVGRNYEQNKH